MTIYRAPLHCGTSSHALPGMVDHVVDGDHGEVSCFEVLEWTVPSRTSTGVSHQLAAP
ncbi:hypothetical protein ABEU19_004653 [Prescottella soli]|uniref:Uncharacterized protein n=1 Tax=Prescottella soli TaxID=1543852 RepID=A0ABW9G0I7_9NOCA